MGLKRLPFQQPIVSRIKEVIVYNESQLTEAIGKLVIETKKFPGLEKGYFPGKVIKIGEPFTLTKPVDLPASCIGLTIDGLNTSLSPGEDGMTAFIINGPFVTLKNLALAGGDGSATAFFETFVRIKGFADNVSISNNLFIGKKLVDGSAADSCDNIHIDLNRMSSTAGTQSWISLINSDRPFITLNRFDGTGTDDAIILGANCSDGVIQGNFLDGCKVTTSASDGGNMIVGNTRDSTPGAISCHSTDVVWPNSRTDGNPGDVWTYTTDGNPPSWQAPSGGAGSADSVEGTVDFGSGGETTFVSVVVAASWITTSKKLSYCILSVTGDPEDAALEELHVTFGNIIANTSFEIFVHAPNGTTGQYKIQVTGV
jgi:hypothetical protein